MHFYKYDHKIRAVKKDQAELLEKYNLFLQEQESSKTPYDALKKLYKYFLVNWHGSIYSKCILCHLPRYMTYWDKEDVSCKKAGVGNPESYCFKKFYDLFISACEQSSIPAIEILANVGKENFNEDED